MSEKTSIHAIRGTMDVLPGETQYYQFVEKTARTLFDLYGYREIRTPVIEPTELFARTIGDSTDIVVSKQMYTFLDQGERSNTLRPEGTAGVVRALIESGLLKESSMQKLYYSGPMFRYEKPQKGRFREFTQIGVEMFGVQHPAADAEIVLVCCKLLERLGFADVHVKINNIGCRECRRFYNTVLREAILSVPVRRNSDGAPLPNWCSHCLKRADVNPMRVFDCTVGECARLAADLPRVSDHVCPVCHDHFDSTINLLEASGLHCEVAYDLVRGLDYYTRTVFEIVEGGLGSQNAVIGGGRYDDLVEDLGGPPTPAVGMSIGVERLVMAMQENAIPAPPDKPSDFYILALDEQSVPTAMHLAEVARSHHVVVTFDCQPKSARAGLKAANKSGARVALIVGAEELANDSAQWKNLDSGEQMELPLQEIERNLTDV